ncbi:MAG: hypothetical protein H2041_08265 [Phenylobacterium sp.]|uniref:hypothetical protein n=1 Tax=Phenylobacterium sp. TaxID=1871053 RepID=UPI00183FCDCC|nr:hypothetical protein [Phenylobacterium sp.]MBA4793644.1 hypothetical protein [Phenylobacterium sp.]
MAKQHLAARLLLRSAPLALTPLRIGASSFDFSLQPRPLFEQPSVVGNTTGAICGFACHDGLKGDRPQLGFKLSLVVVGPDWAVVGSLRFSDDELQFIDGVWPNGPLP